MKQITLLIAVLALAACASNTNTTTKAPAAASAKTEAPVAEETEMTTLEQEEELRNKVERYNANKEDIDKSMILCRRESRTGSHRLSTRCRTLAEIKEEAADAQEMLRRTTGGAIGSSD